MDEEAIDNGVSLIVKVLQRRLKREPTEHEVMVFIFGTPQDREELWNSGAGHPQGAVPPPS